MLRHEGETMEGGFDGGVLLDCAIVYTWFDAGERWVISLEE